MFPYRISYQSDRLLLPIETLPHRAESLHTVPGSQRQGYRCRHSYRRRHSPGWYRNGRWLEALHTLKWSLQCSLWYQHPVSGYMYLLVQHITIHSLYYPFTFLSVFGKEITSSFQFLSHSIILNLFSITTEILIYCPCDVKHSFCSDFFKKHYMHSNLIHNLFTRMSFNSLSYDYTSVVEVSFACSLFDLRICIEK